MILNCILGVPSSDLYRNTYSLDQKCLRLFSVVTDNFIVRCLETRYFNPVVPLIATELLQSVRRR
jgi:hypothetical protein